MKNNIKKLSRAVLVPVFTVALCILPALAQTSGGSRVNAWRKADRVRLAESVAKEKKDVRLLIASKKGKSAGVAELVKQLGGSIEYQADEVDYLRVKVPIEAADKIAASDLIFGLAVDGQSIYASEMIEEGAAVANAKSDDKAKAAEDNRKTPEMPGANTPADNPYVAVGEIGAPQFIAKHPTFDGRGVGVGIVESVPDLILTSLSTAIGPDGRPTRKVANIVDVMEPEDEPGDTNPVVVPTHEVTAANGEFTYEDKKYSVPADGPYRFGLYDTKFVAKIAGESKWKDADLFREADGKARPVAVLWQESTGKVWVDSNQNKDFRDDTVLTDYDLGGAPGVFGVDDPSTAVRESIGFAILADSKKHVLRLMLGNGTHTTATASCAIGKSIFGGAANGVAPEARLFVAYFGGARQYGVIEGTLALMRNPEVNVLWNATAVIQRLSDGESLIPLMWSRAIDYYKKPIFASASNAGPSTATVHDGANGSEVIAVGAYTSGATFWSNSGMESGDKDYVTNLSSRGPGVNGSFKPDIIAPIMQAVPGSIFKNEQNAPAGYKLPPGFMLCNGTSCSSPTAAGAAAILISAAKQSGVTWDADRLKWAMENGARWLQGWNANEQGSGLINIEAAWEMLKKAPEPVRISSKGPVDNVIGMYLRQANQGPGIYEREGWTAGKSGAKTITLRRETGAAGPVRYKLNWQGNDGTFSLETTEVSLPLNQDVPVKVGIQPKTNGIHSASLRVEDADTGLALYRVMTTVVAAEQLDAANHYTIDLKGEVRPLTYKSYFVYVPQGTDLLKLELPEGNDGLEIRAIPPVSQMMALSSDPSASWAASVEDPEAGVWELVLSRKNFEMGKDEKGAPTTLMARMKPQSTIHPELLVTAIGMEDARPAGPGGPITVRNRLASLNGAKVQASLGVMRSENISFNSGTGMIRREIQVAPGSGLLRVALSQSDDADMELSLFDCTSEKEGCVWKKSAVLAGSELAAQIDSPAAGKWVAVVDSYRLPKGSASLTYSDVVTHPLFGKATVKDAPQTLGSGDEFKVEVSPEVDAVPTGSRRLCAVISILDQGTFDKHKPEIKFPPHTADKAQAVSVIVVPVEQAGH